MFRAPRGKDLTNYFSEKYYALIRYVLDIQMYSKGFIWCNAGRRNLYHYDVKELTKYTIQNGNANPSTFQIYEDQQQRLWFVGFKGAYRLDGNSFVNITRNGYITQRLLKKEMIN